MNKYSYVPLTKIKRYVRANWGSPFIVAFMLLLLFAAVLLSTSSSILADDLAVYAYSALVVGVFLQLVCFLKDRKKVTDAEAL
jgi:hypothetical protein